MNASTSRLASAGAVVAAVLTLAACGTAPLSQLDDGQVYYRAQLNRYPVYVTAIDGKGNLNRNPQIDPGAHDVSFTTRPVAGFRIPVEKTYAMRIDACTRYYVAAHRDNSIAQNWDLVIEKSEPVGGCDPAKEWQKAGQPAVAMQSSGATQGTIVSEVAPAGKPN